MSSVVEALGFEPLRAPRRRRAPGRMGRRSCPARSRRPAGGCRARCAAADAVERVQLLVSDARYAAPACAPGSGPRSLTSARRASWRDAHELGDVLGECLGLERRLAEHDLADRLVDDLLEARHVRALLVGARARPRTRSGRRTAARMPFWRIRITFSTPVTPTRERLSCDRRPAAPGRRSALEVEFDVGTYSGCLELRAASGLQA